MRLWRFALVVLLAALTAPPLAVGQIPELPPGMTPAQARQMLRERPELGALLRRRLEESGLSADEIRTRLRQAGYPADLLDPYLTSGDTAPPAPERELVSVVSRLGFARLSAFDSLMLTGDTLRLRLMADSLRADSILREEALAASSRQLELFGLRTFRQPTTQFQPVVTGPVDDSYVLGPGDELVLLLSGAVELAQILEVTRGGFIVIPDVGQIPVNGITLGQLRELLYDRLARVYSGVSRGPNARTSFHITVAGVRLLSIRVTGEVSRPGTYQIAATASVLSALYDAGGVTPRANFRAVEVRRGSQLLGVVDLYDYLLRGTVPTDLPLASGDVVFVPIQQVRVKIAGEVKRPAIYDLKPGETLQDLIEIAGGLTPEAATGNVTIDRILPPADRGGPERARTVVTADLGGVLTGSAPRVPLFPGDSVTVFSIHSGRRDAVAIKGDGVWQPGTYELQPGMRLSDLIQAAGGLRPDAYQGRVQVLRTYPDSTQRLLAARLSETSEPVPQPDVELHELDEVTVYGRTAFRTERPVGVHGAVRRPGSVMYADSMTLRDAVLLAGGVTEDASLVEAEISRLQQPGGDSLALVFRVPLDSSYIVDETGALARPVGAASTPEVVLQPYDHVLIRRVPDFEPPRTVILTGEVRYPGTYTLVERNERLASLVRRAGGLSERAYPKGIAFFRPDQTSGPVVTQSRVGVDLERVLRDPRHAHNLVLQHGDSIHIPRHMSVVRVEGRVHAPGAVPYRPGAALDYYVNGAGGALSDADKGGIYVQQPNGLIERRARPDAGAVVVVPQKMGGQRGASFLEIMGALSPLISAATTIVVVLATR